jgi:hypothetical protein
MSRLEALLSGRGENGEEDGGMLDEDGGVGEQAWRGGLEGVWRGLVGGRSKSALFHSRFRSMGWLEVGRGVACGLAMGGAFLDMSGSSVLSSLCDTGRPKTSSGLVARITYAFRC